MRRAKQRRRGEAREPAFSKRKAHVRKAHVRKAAARSFNVLEHATAEALTKFGPNALRKLLHSHRTQFGLMAICSSHVNLRFAA